MLTTQQSITDSVLANDWHIVCKSGDLGEGKLLKARLLGEDLVAWRFRGKPSVWQDLCAHRGTRLSLGRIKDGKLVCAYHGWTYDSDGRCTFFPAHPEQKPPQTARAKAYSVAEKHGFVWACLGEPRADIPPFPEWDDPSYRKLTAGPYYYKAGAPRAVENFLDVTHFPFVHAGLLGDEAHAEVNDYKVETGPDGIVASDVRVWQPDPDGRGKGQAVNYTYRVFRPLSAYFSKNIDGSFYAMELNVSPVDETNSVAWLRLALNYASETSDEELLSFQDKVTKQDIPIVESQRPEKLPLDLQAELHLRSDRIAVAYRKWLSGLGLTFGTA